MMDLTSGEQNQENKDRKTANPKEKFCEKRMPPTAPLGYVAILFSITSLAVSSHPPPPHPPCRTANSFNPSNSYNAPATGKYTTKWYAWEIHTKGRSNCQPGSSARIRAETLHLLGPFFQTQPVQTNCRGRRKGVMRLAKPVGRRYHQTAGRGI